ncbi:MAG: hypothetical protein ABSA83_07360 [Verrucomicrobiota bacterium]
MKQSETTRRLDVLPADESRQSPEGVSLYAVFGQNNRKAFGENPGNNAGAGQTADKAKPNFSGIEASSLFEGGPSHQNQESSGIQHRKQRKYRRVINGRSWMGFWLHVD